VVPAIRMADAQPRRPAQPEVTPGERKDVAVDLAHLLAALGILRGECPRQRARAAADVQHPPGAGGAEHDPQPAHVVELEMGEVREVDVGRVHAALPQEPPGRPPGVGLGDQLAALGDRRRSLLPMRHAHRLAHGCAPGYRERFAGCGYNYQPGLSVQP